MIAQPEAFRPHETGVAVSFRVVNEEVLPAVDESEFGMRVTLQLEDPEGPEEDAPDLVEWGAFGSLFVLALLSFADARPRGFSENEYRETDELRLAACVDRRLGTVHRLPKGRADESQGAGGSLRFPAVSSEHCSSKGP